MGILTRAELMVQAGLSAGNDQSTAFVRTWLNAWLHRTAKSWSWPILKSRVIDLPITSGSSSVSVGVTGFTTTFIHRIFNPLFYRSSDYKQRGRVLISDLLDGNVDADDALTQASGRLGTPETCKIRMVGQGRFTIYSNPVPDKDYYLTLDVHYIPPNLTTDTQVPWYQSDRTLLQACKCALLELDDGGEGGRAMDQEMLKLAAMVIDDRDFDGEGPGDNVVMGLDKSVFT